MKETYLTTYERILIEMKTQRHRKNEVKKKKKKNKKKKFLKKKKSPSKKKNGLRPKR